MADWDKQRVVVIGGPTASGKTSFSVALAKRFNGEIICADSMQIYKGLDVGTAKVTEEEKQGIEHHLVGFLEPDQVYSVADYVKDAQHSICNIASRNKLPFIVGGTGLYIESLISGIKFQEQKTNPEIRKQLEEQAALLGVNAMHEKLMAIDPDYAGAVHPNNLPRVIRALELYYSTGITMTQQRKLSVPSERPYQSVTFCLDWPREILYERIDRRVEIMLQQGLLAEAELVWKNKEKFKTAAQAIGYKELFPHFENSDTLENCITKLKQSSRNYAKRQLTWFKRMKDVIWLNAQNDPVEKAAEILASF